jgi:hypothetical protein
MRRYMGWIAAAVAFALSAAAVGAIIDALCERTGHTDDSAPAMPPEPAQKEPQAAA